MSTKVQGTEIKCMHKAVKWNGMYVHVSLEEETLCAMSNMCVSVCVCVNRSNVFHGMCAYKCTVHECMYVLYTTLHLRNNASVLCMCLCVHVWCTGYLHNNASVCKGVQCEKYEPKVTASGKSPVCVSVYVCVLWA